MTATERRYTISEKEMLAVFFGIKKFESDKMHTDGSLEIRQEKLLLRMMRTRTMQVNF